MGGARRQREEPASVTWVSWEIDAAAKTSKRNLYPPPRREASEKRKTDVHLKVRHEF